MAQQLEAFIEGVQLARLPRLKQTCQTHACLRPFLAARAATDLANHYQWPDAALGQIVVGTQPFDQHKLKQLILCRSNRLATA